MMLQEQIAELLWAIGKYEREIEECKKIKPYSLDAAKYYSHRIEICEMVVKRLKNRLNNLWMKL